MSLWSRLWQRVAKPSSRPPSAGRESEDRGDLAAALREYEAEGLFSDALRVALLQADAATDPPTRVKALSRAVRVACELGEVPRDLRARYARARLDVLRVASAQSGQPLVWELSSVARELELLEEFKAAAEAYRIAGDRDAEARALMAGGEIDQLEGVLDRENERVRAQRDRATRFSEMLALEASGQRARALSLAREFVAAHPGDDELTAFARSVDEKLRRPPRVTLEVGQARSLWVLGASIIVGRAEADVVIASPVVSRRHIRLFRANDGAPMVEDLGTRNGTFLAGARLDAPVPVRGPMRLLLGNELACSLTPGDDALALEAGGLQATLPLSAEASIGPFRLHDEGGLLRLSAAGAGPRPLLNKGRTANIGVDLCLGDVLEHDDLCIRVIA